LTHIDGGRFDEAIDLLEAAAKGLTGGDAARAYAQRAMALQRAGRVIDTVDQWDRAVIAFRTGGMAVEEAKARQNRGVVHAYLGNLLAAEEDLEAAGRLYEDLGEEIHGVEVLHNRGYVAARRGDLPRALALFDQAQIQAGRLGALRPEMLVDRVEVTLDAGLAHEGRGLAEAAVDIFERMGFDADLPEACLLAARACEQDGDPVRAGEWAGRAKTLFEAQGRCRWRLLATFGVLRAEAASGQLAAPAAEQFIAVAAELRVAGWDMQAVEAEIRGADLLLAAGRQRDAAMVLNRLTPNLYRAAPLNRLQVRLAQVRLQWPDGDRAVAERALLAALRALRAYQATLGSIELRTQAAGYAGEIMALGLAMATAGDQGPRALWWMETVRIAQQTAAASRSADPETVAALKAFREVAVRLGRKFVLPAEATRWGREQAALEEVIRRRSRHAPGPGASWRVSPRIEELSEALGHRVLVEYGIVRKRLIAVVLEEGEARIVDVAAVTQVRGAVAGLRLAHRVALSAVHDAGALAALISTAQAVEHVVVDPLGLPPSRDVVVVAAGPVASLPWSVLPGLGDTNLVVAESADAWRRADRVSAALAEGSVLVVVGPNLHYADAEVEAVTAAWGGKVEIIKGADATVEHVLAAMGEADLVHVAAHGTHRGDNPLLSAIHVHDGPLTGYELAQADTGNALVVLSCCDTGMVDTGASSGIGLSQLLTTTGVATTIASVSPVTDISSAPLMSQLHRQLAVGVRPSRALKTAQAVVGGPLGCPSAAGFVCFGHG
jgi:tetratricopeptide (TPR) repeat protein